MQYDTPHPVLADINTVLARHGNIEPISNDWGGYDYGFTRPAGYKVRTYQDDNHLHIVIPDGSKATFTGTFTSSGIMAGIVDAFLA